MNQKTDLILFGAKGDLSARKLFPALYQLDRAGLLPGDFRILGLAREPMSTESFLNHLEAKIRHHIPGDQWSGKHWQAFAGRFSYIGINFDEKDDYIPLTDWLSENRTSIFYLATPPGLFGNICANLGKAGCLAGNCRVVLEKPIGYDLTSCRRVNDTIAEFFPEENIYRIDHYLGKETVQNLLVLRFANRFINTQWDQGCIDHAQITVAETVGIGDRWPFYDKTGQLRDMVQNHLMQLLCLVAMEPPNSIRAEGIRDEKVKIVRALRTIDESNVADHAVRGQYTRGTYGDKVVPGYLDEEACQDKNSNTETFVALKVFIDNWRWAGVPFYLRTGKRMPEKLTEIVITYKSLPHNIFSSGENAPNRLVIRLQPNEGIEMQMVSKRHSIKEKMVLEKQILNMDFLGSGEMNRIPDAYERLLLNVVEGDQSLFVGREEVEESWRWCDSLIQAWRKQPEKINRYQAGSWGPSKAELLIEKDGRSWHE